MRYYLYNEKFEVIGIQEFSKKEIPLNAIPFVDVPFIKLMVNPQTFEIYEGATPEEIEASKKTPIPYSVYIAKLRLALVKIGRFPSDIDNFIEALPEETPTQKAFKERISSMWYYEPEIRRSSPELNLMAKKIGFTSEELDQLFILANTL